MVFVLLAAGILAIGTFYCRNCEWQFRAGVERQLSSVADLKVSELTVETDPGRFTRLHMDLPVDNGWNV